MPTRRVRDFDLDETKDAWAIAAAKEVIDFITEPKARLRTSDVVRIILRWHDKEGK
jgi:hypothetical protein